MRVEGVGVQAHDFGRHGQERRGVNALTGGPTGLGEDVAVEEAVQQAAQLGPDQLTDRRLFQELGGLGRHCPQVHLVGWVAVGLSIVLLHVLHRAEAHGPRCCWLPRAPVYPAAVDE